MREGCAYVGRLASIKFLINDVSRQNNAWAAQLVFAKQRHHRVKIVTQRSVIHASERGEGRTANEHGHPGKLGGVGSPPSRNAIRARTRHAASGLDISIFRGWVWVRRVLGMQTTSLRPQRPVDYAVSKQIVATVGDRQTQAGS